MHHQCPFPLKSPKFLSDNNPCFSWNCKPEKIIFSLKELRVKIAEVATASWPQKLERATNNYGDNKGRSNNLHMTF